MNVFNLCQSRLTGNFILGVTLFDLFRPWPARPEKCALTMNLPVSLRMQGLIRSFPSVGKGNSN